MDMPTRVQFPLLLEPKRYCSGTFDLNPDRTSPNLPTLKDWIQVFRASIPSFESRAAEDTAVPDAESKSKVFAQDYLKILAAVEAKPEGGHGLEGPGQVTCLKLCAMRDVLLRGLGFDDCFRAIKSRENDTALTLLPDLLTELDAIQEEQDRMLALLKGVFAGNIFDLGAAASADLFKKSGVDFAGTRAKLKTRPFLIDDADKFIQQWHERTYRQAILFVDNAGADVMLGMLPFAREMLRKGTRVVLAANEVPSINDMTARELTEVLSAVHDQTISESLASGKLKVVSSGSDLPVQNFVILSSPNPMLPF
ncbi:hypothetical protein CYMTET_42899 [Cymbomonas tetramitiformis]|uniref:Damage-control phosphatase ARMT1-like metal-binding domain-containing protein n=1 Tax=Cymbomonas tetramitiformis TaxID=36881 RepID=A0AAE0C4K3_9CHLO|nr:hypothetical protein CYMTET_42899 [Cymbomonas tetramitiformis]